MRLPPVTPVKRAGTHRLIPSRQLEKGESVLTGIADDDEHLRALFEVDAATNERLLAERGRALAIGPDELVTAVPHAAVINAAFCHPHPQGARFNAPDRGAWYAAFELDTAKAEVAFHKSIELAEIGSPNESVTYDEYLADFKADFHDLREARGFRSSLDPKSYLASQALAAALLEAGSLGVVYPSTRRNGGTCLACFRPALASHVRPGHRWRFTWTGGDSPQIVRDRPPAR
jgi:RES domain-containing protein